MELDGEEMDIDDEEEEPIHNPVGVPRPGPAFGHGFDGKVRIALIWINIEK